MPKKTIKIATRTSLMAIAQSQLVVNELIKHHPNLNVKLVGITNLAGDKDKTTPLAQMGSIGVFTKGVDDVLLDNKADCAVHSLKDIGTKRPGDLITIAIPPRKAAHDVILFRKDIMDRLQTKERIVIGSSSPRRAHLVPLFLQKALPRTEKPTPAIEVVSLRGNAHSRIQKLLAQKDHDEELDGIVLAFAGLVRLNSSPEGHAVLKPLLDQTRWMVLPLSECPGAPGQGALAVEARASRSDILELFRPLNHKKTEESVKLERNILIEHGGGCHQSFGATCINLPQKDERLLIIKGLDKEKNDISETRWISKHKFCEQPLTFWNGMDWRDDVFQTDILDHPPIEAEAVFVSHSRALEPSKSNQLLSRQVWTSGVQSWFRLAERGIWVEGCADGFGFDYLIREVLSETVLDLPHCKHWNILTHEQAQDTWQQGQVIPTYRIERNITDEAIQSLQKADHVYWSSYNQFEALHDYARSDAVHLCGPGKTAELIQSTGIQNLIVAPNIEEAKKRFMK